MTDVQTADPEARPERVETDPRVDGDAPASTKQSAKTLGVTRVLGVYLSIATLIALLSAVSIWPAVESVTNADDGPTSAATAAVDVVEVVIFPRINLDLSPGQAVLAFALVMGATGGGLAGLRALAEHRAAEDFKTSYTWWYVIRPLIGAGLAVIVYLVLRAGLVGAAPTTVLNAFGVGSVAALSGLFAQNVLERLNLVIEALFGSIERGAGADGGPSAAR